MKLGPTFNAGSFFIIIFRLLLSYMINYLIISSLIAIFIIFSLAPSFSLACLALSVPVINWVFKLWGLEAPLSDLIAALSTGAWLISILFNLAFKPKEKIKLKLLLIFPFAFFIIAQALSLFNHPQPLNGLYYISRWLILLYIAYILVPANIIRKGKTLKTTIWALAISAFIVAVSGWLSLLGQDWHDSFFRVRSISWWGIYPFGENHNLIAEFLSVGAFLWLALKEWTNSERLRRIYKVIFVFILGAAIMTFSRAAWITIILQLAIYTLWHNRQFFKKQGGLVLLIIIATSLLLLPVFWRMKILQDENTSSTENRVLLTEIAYEAWLDKPILGQGSGQFTELVANNIRFTAKYGAAIDSHGFLQKIIAESGIIGLIAWFFLLFVIARKAINDLKKYSQRAPWLLPLWIAASGGLFFQIFNTSYYKGKVWLIIALALIAGELIKNDNTSKN